MEMSHAEIKRMDREQWSDYMNATNDGRLVCLLAPFVYVKVEIRWMLRCEAIA